MKNAQIGRGTFIRLGTAAALFPFSGTAADERPKIGPLGKVVGELPPGRYDDHMHVWGPQTPDPEGFRKQLTDAGFAGGVLFSGCSGDYHKMWWKLGRKAPKPEKLMDDVIAWCSAMPTLYPYYWIEVESPSALDEVDMAVEKGIYGFKIMTNHCRPMTEKTLPLYRKIAAKGKPIIFHTGMVWDFGASSDFFRPAAYEALVAVPGLRFAMGHCSWPWVEECVATYGKSQNAQYWLKEKAGELFLDTTPGTPPARRKAAFELVWKIGYDVKDHVLFGSDFFTNDYNVKIARWMQTRDDAVLDELGVSDALRDSYYRGALQRFLFGS